MAGSSLFPALVLLEQRCFDDAKFMAYLEYLLYLTAPPYARLFAYPNGLEFLKLLLQPEFLKRLQNNPAGMIDFIHKQQYHHWLNKAPRPA